MVFGGGQVIATFPLLVVYGIGVNDKLTNSNDVGVFSNEIGVLKLPTPITS